MAPFLRLHLTLYIFPLFSGVFDIIASLQKTWKPILRKTKKFRQYLLPILPFSAEFIYIYIYVIFFFLQPQKKTAFSHIWTIYEGTLWSVPRIRQSFTEHERDESKTLVPFILPTKPNTEAQDRNEHIFPILISLYIN